MATISDVARLAGVSTSTVSRVLNNRPASRDAVAQVKRAVEELDYRVNESARGLAQRYANVVGVVVADISNPPISRMFHGLSAKLQARGMTVMLGNSEASEERELEILQMFAVQRARGVIYTGMGISENLARVLNSFPAPVVVAAQAREDLHCPVVLFDNYGASHDVVTLMMEAGHRRIGFISGPLQDQQAGEQRQRGFVDALESAGVEILQSYIEHAEFTIDSGYHAMCRMVNKSDVLPTAVLGASDLIAIGAMRCLQDRGIEIPNQISVFGFDNIPVGSKLVPSLSTVELDFHELGEVCADLLYRLFDRKESHVRKVQFDHKIIVRESFMERTTGHSRGYHER